MSDGAFTVTGVSDGLLPPVGLAPPLMSLPAPVPPWTGIKLPVAGKLMVQLVLAPAAMVWPLGQAAVLGAPGRLPAFGKVQKASLLVASEPTLVQVTVQLTVAPAFAGFGAHTTLLVMSALFGGGDPFTGTEVLESLLPCWATASLVAALVASTGRVPAAVGTKLTVQASVPAGARLAAGEHTGTGLPGRLAALVMEQLALVAVLVPTFSQTAVQTTRPPMMPGFGEQVTVLTMSGVFGVPGGATMVTVSLPGLLAKAVAGSLLAAVVLVICWVNGVAPGGAVNTTVQPSAPPAARFTPTEAFGQFTTAPGGNAPGPVAGLVT